MESHCLLFMYIVSQATIELCQTHATDINALKILFSSLTLISKLFYSLNFQVRPPPASYLLYDHKGMLHVAEFSCAAYHWSKSNLILPTFTAFTGPS